MIIFYHASFFFFLNTDLYFLSPVLSPALSPVINTNFLNPIAILIVILIPTKEAKAEMETHSVTVEINFSHHNLFKVYLQK